MYSDGEKSSAAKWWLNIERREGEISGEKVTTPLPPHCLLRVLEGALLKFLNNTRARTTARSFFLALSFPFFFFFFLHDGGYLECCEDVSSYDSGCSKCRLLVVVAKIVKKHKHHLCCVSCTAGVQKKCTNGIENCCTRTNRRAKFCGVVDARQASSSHNE